MIPELPSLIKTSILALVGAGIFFLVRRLQQGRQLRELSRQHGCESPPSESDFQYDLFGIAKAIELGAHFRRRTSLLYTNTLFRKYGETYVSNVLGYRLIFTCNAENIKHLFSKGFADYDSSPLRKPLFAPITPHGIFTVDGPDWRKAREQLRNQLSSLPKIIDLRLCERHFQAFRQRVPHNGKAFDIQPCIFSLSLDIQSSFTLGECVDALSFTQSPANKRFVKDLLLVKDRIANDGFRGPLRHLYPRQSFRDSCMRARQHVMDRAIRAAEKQANNCGMQGTNEQSAKGYAFMRGLSTKIDDASQLTDQSLSILLANDSMGTTLSGLLFSLSQNPRVVHKLRASILESIGLTPPKFAQLGRLQYVRCVLHEALRLYPPAAFNARVANKTATLPRGGGSDASLPVLVRKGDTVVFSTWARHRLGRDFGENPENFIPERWEHLSGDMAGFIPFNKGPRVCPGQHYAMVVLTYVVARIFQTFSTVINYNTHPWRERISMTLENENGVMVGLS
ncbi:cytochrome P450 [Aspergillus coremiiformis]|uniref:Cytochrome P450 n=1 Tax=Aspergillus coremiiformis TaxID=138285 RepID=A0A5N6Z6U6_9EURO|nr:cytochrome P450 [Aspergillus coremiiformis]